MKILVFADGVATRQWLGRLFNETGVYFDRSQLYEIRFFKRIADAMTLIRESGAEQCRAVVWSSQATAGELNRLARLIPVAVIPCTASQSESLAGSNCRLIDEEELDAMHLLEWMESRIPAGTLSPL